jgi:hypothetical protein
MTVSHASLRNCACCQDDAGSLGGTVQIRVGLPFAPPTIAQRDAGGFQRSFVVWPETSAP